VQGPRQHELAWSGRPPSRMPVNYLLGRIDEVGAKDGPRSVPGVVTARRGAGGGTIGDN
jgi:hypothetical protein